MNAISRSTTILLLLVLTSGSALAHDMRFDSVEGDVTTNEYNSFIEHLDQQLPPTPSNNIGNVMVYERVGGGTLHGMQTFYAFTKDRRVLDKTVEWSDAFLHARNDPTNGRIMWTASETSAGRTKTRTTQTMFCYTGAENGDVIEHICNTAKLILENPSVWNETAPPDGFGFGNSYLERAKTYVRECQRSAETTIVPGYVRDTKDGYRLIHPDSPGYYKYCESTGPVPGINSNASLAACYDWRSVIVCSTMEIRTLRITKKSPAMRQPGSFPPACR